MARPSPSVAELARLTARSWRGLEEEPYGEWLLRAAGGFTGRANSVLVTGAPPAPLAEAVAAVSRWYAERGLPARAQVPMPGADDADAAFAAAGWRRDEDTLVLTAALDGWPHAPVPVELAPEPDAAWLAGYRHRGAALPRVAWEVLLTGGEPVFAAVRRHPAAAPLAGVARGVVVDGWLCVTALAVAEDCRRHGLATAIMAALGGWAAGRGSHSCVLQVVAGNRPARRLYARMGFTEHHRYHYRLAAG